MDIKVRKISSKKLSNDFPIINNNNKYLESKRIVDNIMSYMQSNNIDKLQLFIHYITINCDKMCCPRIELEKNRNMIITDGNVSHLLSYSINIASLRLLYEGFIETISTLSVLK